MTIKDPYNTPIIRGAKVAYNYQGEVRLGYVNEVKPVVRNGKKTDWSGRPYVSIIIDNIPTDFKNHKLFKSKVSNPNNLVVVVESQHTE